MQENTEQKRSSYNGSIQSLLNDCEQDWGDPNVNLEGLVPYGIDFIDPALYGIDIVNGDMILVLGQEKNRKTTFVENVVINYMIAKQPVVKPGTCIDTLEPGMPPKRVRDNLICNLATRYLLEIGHKHKGPCPLCEGKKCRQIGLSPEYLRYQERSPEQAAVVEAARMTMQKWPLFIYGPNPHEGDTRDLKKSVKRWRILIHEQDIRVIITDHVQQYRFSDGFTGDYEKQVRAVAACGDVVAQEKVAFFVISQVSLTSVREAKQGLGRVLAAGGQKGAQEANVEFTCRSDTGYVDVNITGSRRSGLLGVTIPLEDESGAFAGPATVQQSKKRNT